MDVTVMILIGVTILIVGFLVGRFIYSRSKIMKAIQKSRERANMLYEDNVKLKREVGGLEHEVGILRKRKTSLRSLVDSCFRAAALTEEEKEKLMEKSDLGPEERKKIRESLLDMHGG